MKLAIALGASLGDRRRTLETALRSLAAKPGLSLVRVSRWYRTPPLLGGTARNWFLNGVALFETDQDPDVVLQLCIALEAQAGRRRARFWGDRPLDLDLLLADGIVRSSGRLTLPHPAIGRRPFVLVPLLDVWPDATDPATGIRYASLPAPSGPRPVPVGVTPRRAPIRFL